MAKYHFQREEEILQDAYEWQPIFGLSTAPWTSDSLPSTVRFRDSDSLRKTAYPRLHLHVDMAFSNSQYASWTCHRDFQNGNKRLLTDSQESTNHVRLIVLTMHGDVFQVGRTVPSGKLDHDNLIPAFLLHLFIRVNDLTTYEQQFSRGLLGCSSLNET